MSYGPEHIKRLKGLEAVRVRPAMYVYDSGERGQHHLIREAFDNAVDEHINACCDLITITFHKDGEYVSVRDNGRGIPVDPNPEEPEVSTLEMVLTNLHAGGKFVESSAFKAAGGLHGIGSKCINALSDDLEVRVWRDDPAYMVGEYVQRFSKGVATSGVEAISSARPKASGTLFRWRPDVSIFKDGIDLKPEIVEPWLEVSAYLNPGLRIVLVDERAGTTKEFYSSEGITAFLRVLGKSSEQTFPAAPMLIEGVHDYQAEDGAAHSIKVQVALQWGDSDVKQVYGFANNIRTQDGGRHVDGLENTLPRLVNRFGKDLGLVKEKDAALTKADCLAGVLSIVNVMVVQPEFQGQTKDRLMSREAEPAVAAVVTRVLTEILEKNPTLAKQMVDRAIFAQKLRNARNKAGDTIKRQSLLGNRLPGKLVDCDLENPQHTELFLVEGDSAMGGATLSRDPNRQAVLALRGKIINVERYDLERLLANAEVQAIIGCVGTGIGDDFDVAKLRYHKIILMTDADDDGLHIRSLLLTLFQRFMPGVVAGGFLYIAQPPLYKVESGKKKEYCQDDAALARSRARLGDKADVTRFKGLGEMNPDELGETTMEVGRRHLLQVRTSDVEAAERMISTLMGDSPAARKEHIVSRSASIRVEA